MKIKDFQKTLQAKNCDFAFFYNLESSNYNPNFYYFSGFNGLGALVIPKNKRPFLIAPKMEFERARQSMINKVYEMDKKKFFDSVRHTVRKNKIRPKKIAIDNTNFNLNSFKHFRKHFKKSKFNDVALDCIKLREIKTDKEVGYLKKSCAYADQILQKTIKNFKEFKTESDVAAFLVYETKKLGLELSFNPIVASGSNGSMPHYEPGNVKLKKGLCVIDFGVKYRGYCSDITRTVSIGKPNDGQKKAYGMLLKIQRDVIKKIEPGKNCSELYEFVCASLGKYKNNFTHGLGHGVGVEIHEMPNLTLNSKDKIQNNMAFTIEPGIYFPGKFGIRIEDTVLFKNKVEVLTKTNKKLIVV